MSELSCSPITVRLKRSLIHGNLYATRPLFEPVQTGHLTKSLPRVLQMNHDFYLSDTVLFLEKFRPNRVFRFKIKNFFYLFINYTFAGIAKDITKLSPTLFPINETITSRDYIADSSILDYEPIEDRNLNAILATLASSNLRNERIHAFLNSQSNYSSVSSANLHLSNLSHLIHNSFLVLLSSLSSPFFNAILSILTVLALTWGLILTVYTIVSVFKTFKRTLMPMLSNNFQRFRSRFVTGKNTNESTPGPNDSNSDELLEHPNNDA